MNEVSKIKIEKDKIGDWLICEDTTKDCLRDSSWGKIKL